MARAARIVAALQPGCEEMKREWGNEEETGRKWRENEEMRRKWRENEEMERDWLSTFPHSLSISSLFLHFLPLFPFPTSKCVTFCCKMLNTALLSRMSQKSQHTLGGERNMKQRIPINSITSKLVLKSMYASCSTGPFFADHYSHRFEKTQLKFRQEKWLPVKISCIIWNEICKKKKLIKNRNGIFCQKFLIFLKSLKSLNKNFY